MPKEKKPKLWVRLFVTSGLQYDTMEPARWVPFVSTFQTALCHDTEGGDRKAEDYECLRLQSA
jgi:hypothetical protein